MDEAFGFLTGIGGNSDDIGTAAQVAVRGKPDPPSLDMDKTSAAFFAALADPVRIGREQEPGDCSWSRYLSKPPCGPRAPNA